MSFLNYAPSYAPWFAPDTTTTTSTIVGSNIQEGDGPIERRVLDKVGSYGYQLNRIIDVLSILLERTTANGGLLADLEPDLSDLKPDEVKDNHVPTGEEARQSIKDFYKMAAKAAKESEECKREATSLAVERLIKRMARLKETDTALYNIFRDQIKAALK
jgi:hypothetical protein